MLLYCLGPEEGNRSNVFDRLCDEPSLLQRSEALTVLARCAAASLGAKPLDAERLDVADLARFGSGASNRLADRMRELAGANFAREAVDLNRWRRGMKRTIERVGLLCSGDVKASVTELLAANEKLKVHSEPVRELMMFGLSDAHIEVRMTLGVAR